MVNSVMPQSICCSSFRYHLIKYIYAHQFHLKGGVVGNTIPVSCRRLGGRYIEPLYHMECIQPFSYGWWVYTTFFIWMVGIYNLFHMEGGYVQPVSYGGWVYTTCFIWRVGIYNLFHMEVGYIQPVPYGGWVYTTCFIWRVGIYNLFHMEGGYVDTTHFISSIGIYNLCFIQRVGGAQTIQIVEWCCIYNSCFI